jgi:hypothetical protein|nr:MAG TPA_asm: hypothetical protein [Caudoviricetes sp.]
MSCNNCKNVYQKSAQAAYNNAEQAYVAAGTNINVLGNLITDTGVSISTQTGGFRINNGGLFRISYDVTSTPAAAGAQVVQLYNGSSAMPCAIATDTVAADGVITQHIETVIRLATCCAMQPTISARISGVAGTINHVCASAVKLA